MNGGSRVAFRPWLSSLFGAALALAAFAYLMAYPPALSGADESYILYEAKRLHEGDAPYHDFFDFIMPGTMYYYALAYTVAGTTITAARGATAILNAASCWLVFVLARQTAPPALAGLAAGAFVAGMVPTWNHAGHHWAATCLSLAAAAVVLAHRWRNSDRARPACTGAFAAALVCSHQGRGAWVIVWLAVALPLLTWARWPSGWGRRLLREAGWMTLGAVAVATPMLGWVVWRASLGEVIYATYTFVAESYVRANVGYMAWAGAFSFQKPVSTTWPWLLRALPALLAVEGLSLVGTILAEGLRRHVVRALQLLLAVCTAGSVFYFPDYIHVATIAPFSLVVLAGLAHRIGTALGRLDRSWLVAAWRLGWVVVVVAVVEKGGSNLRAAWADNPVRVPSGFGTLATTDTSARTLEELQREISAGRGQRPGLFAYSPTDTWLYLAVPADNPTPFCLLNRGYSTPQQFDAAIDGLRRSPDAFVLVRAPLVRPGDPIMELLQREYQKVGSLGRTYPPLALHGLDLYARRERDVSPPVED